MVQLSGITWNHTRGYVPMVATAQRFCETHPGLEIRWEKRSLQAFADCPLERLAEDFDLLVIDHPFVGAAAAQGTLVPLDDYLAESFLKDQAQNSVGKSHESYFYSGRQWALAIDAATPVSSCRRDLLEQAGIPVPESWEELLELARRGMVAFPAIAVDSLMHFYMLCSSLGEDPFLSPKLVISEETGVRALAMLRELATLCPPACFSWNPIATYEAISSSSALAYCPFAYAYSNYARCGYAPRRLEFGDLVKSPGGGRCRSTLGGTGLAISARCQHKETAAEYVQFVASPECQRTLYFQSGGQPGHRSAWLDGKVNEATHDFFRNTLEAHDRAFLRPRYHGYLHFQDRAGSGVREFLLQGGDPRPVLKQLDWIYLDSLKSASGK
jgi:multiple sugar transport system substrate-binding protein